MTVVTDPTPTLRWSYYSAGSHPQVAYQVVIWETTEDAVLLDTGLLYGADTSYDVEAYVLANSASYEWYVTAWDDQGLSGTMTTASFDTTFSAPAAPTSLDATATSSTSSVDLTWDASALDAEEFYRWVIYRTDPGAAAKVIDTVEDQATLAYTDYGCPLDGEVTYSLTQDNGWAESTADTDVVTLPALSAHSWQLVVGGDARLTIELPPGAVTAAPSDAKSENETYRVMGRTIQITESTPIRGNSGSVTLMLYPSTLYLEGRIQEISAAGEPCWLKDSYRKSTNVLLTSLARQPLTAGRLELTLGWIEVA